MKIAVVAVLATGVLAGAAGAGAALTASVVSPIVDEGGMLAVTIRCSAAPNVEPCAGSFVLPELGAGATRFSSVAPGTTKRFQVDFPPSLNATVAAATTLTVDVTQSVDGADQTASFTVKVTHQPPKSAGGGGGDGGKAPAPGAQGRDAPTVPPGPATRYTAIRDRVGDAHTTFDLPQIFDLVRATARRVGNSVTLSVTSTSAITKHDSYGNPIGPCVQIPWAAPQQYPMFLFPNGQLSGYEQHNWPRMKTSIRGATISWTLPRWVLAKKGFTKGFLWRATGGCDARALVDTAPDKGFAAFRWTKVG